MLFWILLKMYCYIVQEGSPFVLDLLLAAIGTRFYDLSDLIEITSYKHEKNYCMGYIIQTEKCLFAEINII